MSTGNNVLEEQPLLSSSKPPSYHDSRPETSSCTQDGEIVIVVDDDSDSPKDPWTRKQITIYSVLTAPLLGLSVLVILTKFFIDADDVKLNIETAFKSALEGGLSGAAATVLQVLMFMPLRTITNYQCQYGTTTMQAIKLLYADGGWTRYYQGLLAALVQGPVSRFCDTAANVGILAFFESNPYMRTLPAFVQTAFASVAASCFRMMFSPADMVKTAMQIPGQDSITLLRATVTKYGSLWYGAFATAAAKFVDHYPWFGTYNYLDAVLPLPINIVQKLLRFAVIGLAASIASDIISNSLRAVKTCRQVNVTPLRYTDAADGVKGLFHGLKTRVLSNSLQGIMFSVLWKLFLDLWDEKTT